MEVVDDAPGDGGVELSFELTEVGLQVALSRRRKRIDAERVVAGRGERRHHPAELAAPQLDDARRRRGQVL